MRNSTIVFSVAVATLAGAVGMSLLKSRTSETPAIRRTLDSGRGEPGSQPPAGDTEAMAAMRQELRALRGVVAQNAASVDAIKAESARFTEAAAAQDAPANGGIPDERAEAEEIANRKAVLADIEAEFSLEPRDGSWSPATTAMIQRVVRQNEALSGALRAVDCRSKTCRVELVDDAASDLARNMNSIVRGCSRDLPNIAADHLTGSDGKPFYVLYMSKGEA